MPVAFKLLYQDTKVIKLSVREMHIWFLWVSQSDGLRFAESAFLTTSSESGEISWHWWCLDGPNTLTWTTVRLPFKLFYAPSGQKARLWSEMPLGSSLRGVWRGLDGLLTQPPPPTNQLKHPNSAEHKRSGKDELLLVTLHRDDLFLSGSVFIIKASNVALYF